eukprot:CAMPEP_0195119686 /NCGR_PEP_ID=MMETSP0448-20130528/120080_1 /TAXON_ID=66468 /ORGANISM="Heterocapsa triquestra, Strain CCMP 448" /LENGTH=49 /DNA_ID= /DNA_START= /DNA_END= /DNA_ORIENTATION=
MAQEEATKKAQALHAKLRAGEDDEASTRDFLRMGSSIPDALVLAAVGTR